MFRIIHHGGKDQVTGSCHELILDEANSLLVDCGMFQGLGAEKIKSSFEKLELDFEISKVQALFVTHCHLDHIGRIPHLLIAGFAKKIYCTEATAVLLSIMLEDLLKVGFDIKASLIQSFLDKLEDQIIPIDYRKWTTIQTSIPSQKF